MIREPDERLVIAFEKIAKALEAIHEEAKRAGTRYWPEPGKQKESVVSRVPTDEDRAKENLGLSDESTPINKWLEPDWLEENDEGVVGERSAQWLREHPPEKPKEAEVIDASPEAPVRRKKGRAGTKKAESKA